MSFGNIDRRILLAAHLCAWLSCIAARLQADFEIESFTRYRIDNFDNNNNGYVDHVDDSNSSDSFESYAVAETIDKSGSLGSFQYNATPIAQQIESPYFDPFPTSSAAVHVQFRTPDGFLLGFVDYGHANAAGTPVVIGANGYVDEIISLPGHDITKVADPAGNIFATDVDFGDLHTFNASFERMQGSSYMQSRGVQVERVFRFRSKLRDEDNEQSRARTTWEFFYGARIYQFDDSYTFDANGGILGRTWAQTMVDNEHGGPHFGVGWNAVRGVWTFAVSGLMQAGIATTNSSQTGTIGEDLNPGGVNAIFAQPHVVNAQADDQFGSLYGELRAQAERQITDQITVNVGCSGYYFGDMKYADDSINWSLPEFGLANNGTDDELITTAFASLEFRH